MKIKNTKSNVVVDVTQTIWEKMIQKGLSRNYIIVSTEKSAVEMVKPEELEDSDFKTLIERAKTHRRDGEFNYALAAYREAYAIKPLPYIKGIITTLSNISNTKA